MSIETIRKYSKVGVVSTYIDLPCPNKGTDYCKDAAYVAGGKLEQAGLYLLTCPHCKHQWEFDFDVRYSNNYGEKLSKKASLNICKHCNEEAGYFWENEDDENFAEGKLKCPRVNCMYLLEHIVNQNENTYS